MAKKNKAKVVYDEPKVETHMEVFRRLAAVKNMHGTPGMRKPKGGGK